MPNLKHPETLAVKNAVYVGVNAEQVDSEIDLFTERRYLQFSRLLRLRKGKVLDIGCNTGRGGFVLKQDLPDVELDGLDCVADRLARLPPDVYSGKLLGFASAIDRADYTYDAVLAGEFIEHLYPADVDQTLCEIFRVLKLGGQLLLTTPNPQSIWLRWRGQSVLGGAHLSQHYKNGACLAVAYAGLFTD
jgi:SAM-dependent methyltransferase